MTIKKGKVVYKVMWDGVCLELRFDSEGLHYLSHSVGSEVDENQSVAVYRMFVGWCIGEQQREEIQ